MKKKTDWDLVVEFTKKRHPKLKNQDILIRSSLLYNKILKFIKKHDAQMKKERKMRGGLNIDDVVGAVTKYAPIISTGLTVAKVLSSFL